MHLRSKSMIVFVGAALLALALAACGGSDDNSTSNAAADVNTGSGGGQTVATQSISGVGDVLVDSSGKALYTNDMDTGSKIACTGQCLTEWVPLAAPSGGQPTSEDSAGQAKLGTLKRPDGSSQVTFGGLPLYTFVEDASGQVTGNGFTDSFGGTTFVWTVAASPGGESSSAGGTTTSGGASGGGGYGGY